MAGSGKETSERPGVRPVHIIGHPDTHRPVRGLWRCVFPTPSVATAAPHICHPRPPYSSSPLPLLVILAKAGIHGPRHACWIPTFVGMTGWGLGMMNWGLGMTKVGDPFSVGAQHDVPREITRFPKGHVKPCPYGTYVEVDAPSGNVGHVKPCPCGIYAR